MCQLTTHVEIRDQGYNAATWIQGVGAAVFVPKSFEPAYRYPLVVWLEASNTDFEARTWFPLMTSRNVVAVSLQPNRPGPHAWGSSLRDISREIEFIRRSIRELAQEIAVHPRRIFLAGCGTAAAIVARVLGVEPERFAGAILIDPESIPDHDARLLTGSPVLVARRRNAGQHPHQSASAEWRGMESIQGRSKTELSRRMNHWIMAQVEAAPIR